MHGASFVAASDNRIPLAFLLLLPSLAGAMRILRGGREGGREAKRNGRERVTYGRFRLSCRPGMSSKQSGRDVQRATWDAGRYVMYVERAIPLAIRHVC